jgi:hypothetical protein
MFATLIEVLVSPETVVEEFTVQSKTTAALAGPAIQANPETATAMASSGLHAEERFLKFPPKKEGTTTDRMNVADMN